MHFASFAVMAILASCAPACLAARIHFESPEYTVRELDGMATINVRCSPASSVPVTVQYSTSDLPATAGGHYLPQFGRLTFAAGQSTASFMVPLINDFAVESARLARLTLSEPTGGAILGQPSAAVLVIQDDERPVALDLSFNPILPPGNWIRTMTVQLDGKIVLGGKIRVWGGFAGSFAQLNPDGSRDPTDAGMPPHVLAYGPDGTSYGYSWGEFFFPGGDFSRFHADGSVDPEFQVTVEQDSSGIQSAAILADGKLLVGGKAVRATLAK